MIDWKIRAETLAAPEHSDAVKHAMMRFWLAADRHDNKRLTADDPLAQAALKEDMPLA